MHYLSDRDIQTILQMSAKEVYGIAKKEELKKWTTHSIRVGAAVKLHEAGKDGSYIKLRLRWRSDTFMVYLRNTRKIAQAHMEAINQIANE